MKVIQYIEVGGVRIRKFGTSAIEQQQLQAELKRRATKVRVMLEALEEVRRTTHATTQIEFNVVPRYFTD